MNAIIQEKMEILKMLVARGFQQRLDTLKYLAILTIVSLLGFLAVFKFRSFMVFLAVACIAGIINYVFHSMHIHVHLGHVAFLSILFSYSMGLKYGILMIIIAHILPELLVGHVDLHLFSTGIAYGIVSFLASLFTGASIIALGLTLAVIQTIMTATINMATGAQIHKLIIHDGLELGMNVFYFTFLALPLLALMGM
jgi:hypothetical protein